MHATDLDLVGRFQRGDDEASQELVRRYGRGLFALAFSLLGSAADAEDVVQETMLAAFEGAATFEGRASARTWLSRILFNRASKLRRSKAVRRAASLSASGVSGSVTAEAGRNGNGRSADGEAPRVGSHADRVERSIDIAAMLESLSEDHREVIVLREVQGLSYQETARALGVPVGTVESRLYRARQELKAQFGEYLS